MFSRTQVRRSSPTTVLHSESRLRFRSLGAAAALAALPVLLSGCGLGGSAVTSSPVTTSGGSRGAVSGTIYGGQQPVSGATISLYAAGKTATGSAARSMLTTPVVSGADGSFSITGLYSCQTGDQVYIVASGGNSGAGVNTAIKMMAALGPCSTLVANAATTFINVDEVTTVGSVYALASYMTGAANVGSDASTASTDALAAAFANTKTMVDTTYGVALTTSTGNGIVPQTTINSLANSIASCVNSGAASSTSCSNLFTNTTVTGSTPADTLQAALNLAHFPATNPSGVFSLAGSTPPFQPTLTAAPASYAITVAHPSDVLTYHNNNSRTGVQSSETTLTPANVNSTQFGKLRTFPVDSYLFAQPLYVGGVGMPDGLVHNLLMVATTHGTVYAFDADGTSTTALWTVSLLPSGERYATANDFGCSNPPEAGVVGTPVIDRVAGSIYMVMKSINSTTGVFTQRLYALSLIDGSERTGSPVVIAPTFTGTGAGTAGTTVTFNPQTQSERSALLLAPNASGTNTVWIAFASHCDIAPYHGIIMGYDGTSLANTAAYIDTPNGSDGGIWMSNGGMIADAQGYIYTLTGNGTFDANVTGGADYGDAALKLAPPAAGASSNLMSLSQYFVPFNQADLNSHDLDVGGAEGILISDPQSGVAPQVLIASDKNGSVYLINTAQMDGYDNNGTATNVNGDIQDFTAGGTFIYNFAFFNNMLYTSTPMKAFAYVPGTSTTAGSLNTTAVAQNSVQAAPVVSANGTTNGIVWAQDTSGEMHAYSTNLTELYNTAQAASSRDAAPTFVKFTSPLIANGKVFLSGANAVSVYGSLQ